MLNFFRWIKRSDEDYSRFEQVLADLENEIREEKGCLEQDRQSSKGILYSWYYYNVPLCILVSLVLVQLSRTLWSDEPWRSWLEGLAPIALYPAVIYFGGRLIKAFYRRRITKKEKSLERLKAKQKLKLEELKKKTGYYVTKGIVERYEEADTVNTFAPPDEDVGGIIMSESADGTQDAEHEYEMPDPFAVEPMVPDEDLAARRFSNNELSSQRIIPLPRKEQKVFNGLVTTALNSPKRNVYDKVIDWIVGDVEGPTQTYALICESCHAHCGLALPELFFAMEFYCPYCNHFNSNASKLKSPFASTSNPNIFSDSNLKKEAGAGNSETVEKPTSSVPIESPKAEALLDENSLDQSESPNAKKLTLRKKKK